MLLQLLSSPKPPCHLPSPFSRRSTPVNPTRLHVFNPNQIIHGHTSTRNPKLRDFLTLPSSEKLQALTELHKNGEMQTISDFNHLLMSLVASDEFELALNLKSSLSSLGLFPNDWTYSILVSFYCKKGDPIEAKIVLDHMLENGFDPNVATFTTLIGCFCRSGHLKHAYEVFDVMSKRGCQPTINTYNCLIKGLCYVGRVEEAFDVLTSIKKSSSMKPDIYTYTAMMDGFCKVGRTNEALRLLSEALEMGFTPSVVTYNTLFNGYFKEGRPFCGFGLLRRMKDKDCKPDYISYSTMLHGLLKWGKVKPALDIYKRMVEVGLQVDERIMNTLLRGLCRRSRKEKELLKEVYNVFDKMVSGNYVMYGDEYDLVIEAFCMGREAERAYENLIKMIRIGYSPKTFTFNIVMYVLCGVGEVDKALEVLMLMHKNRKPNGIPFGFLIDELNQQGRSLEACHVYGLALKRGVAPTSKPSKYSTEQRYR